MATKYFCDRCKRECDQPGLSKLSIEKASGLLARGFDLCAQCKSDVICFIQKAPETKKELLVE